MAARKCWARPWPRLTLAEMLAAHTTLRVGGPAAHWVEATTQQQIIDAVAQADEAGRPVLILSGGSNMVVSDEGFPGTVVKIATRGISHDVASCETEGAACGGVLVTVAAGELWDDVVKFCVDRELVGVEALSGIPGLAGATPVQNVGAYGQEVSNTLWSVRTYDRTARAVRTFANMDCDFGYRTSRFKREPGRYVVLEVTFQLLQGPRSEPLRFGELARRLGVSDGERAPLQAVRDTVLELRRGKGMVDDPNDPDSFSAGSFFTNPVVSEDVASSLPSDAPRYAQPDGKVKTSAAWLIEHAGFGKGYGVPPVTLSTKHTLAITNRGGATASQVVALAREIRDGVQTAFGIRLVPEPVFVGVTLD